MTKYTEYRHRKSGDRVYVETQHLHTDFKDKWGIHATDLAKQEGVSTEAIHQRVYLYKNPHQRAKKPTLCEKIHNKTDVELALELNIHPQSVRVKVKKYGDAYHPGEKEGPNKGVIFGKTDWRESRRTKSTRFWLAPLHENYPHEDRKGL